MLFVSPFFLCSVTFATLFEIESKADFLTLLHGSSPVLISVYDPQCGWCRKRKPSFRQLADLFEMNPIEFEDNGNGIKVSNVNMSMASLNCRTLYDFCGSLGVHALPTLLSINFNNSHAIDYQETTTTAEEMYASTMSRMSLTYGSTASTAERTFEKYPYTANAPLHATSKASQIYRLQDGMQAFLYILHHEVFFLKDDTMSEVELHALQLFIGAVVASFPDPQKEYTLYALHRQVIQLTHLDKSTWLALVRQWQVTTSLFFSQEHIEFGTLETGPLPRTLYTGEGENFATCGTFTCGVWTLFHIMAMNIDPTVPHGVDLVYFGIRTFVKHFFTCTHCRVHFLQAMHRPFHPSENQCNLKMQKLS